METGAAATTVAAEEEAAAAWIWSVQTALRPAERRTEVWVWVWPLLRRQRQRQRQRHSKTNAQTCAIDSSGRFSDLTTENVSDCAE